MTDRICAWCRGPIPATMRSDALCCSQSCRQARHRFTTGVGPGPVAGRSTTPLRLAYDDPPYPGLSRRYYENHRDVLLQLRAEAGTDLVTITALEAVASAAGLRL